jgi:hypothetical protein
VKTVPDTAANRIAGTTSSRTARLDIGRS